MIFFSKVLASIAVVLFIWTSTCSALEDFNVTEEQRTQNFVSIIDEQGERLYMTEQLLKKLQEEREVWHWTPWLKTRTKVLDNFIQEVECVGGDSIDSFPDPIFDDDQLRKGGFLLYVIFGIYAFTLLAIVCNDYFIPCVEIICEDLKIPQNVAAATFMSVATSCPEFFVNVISTFLTESDMGIGTIVGSALFNALGVAAIGGLAAVSPIAIEMRPVTRDVLIYMFNVSVLVVIVWDGQIDWYEALVLAILYVLYFVIMFNSVKIFRLLDKIIILCCNKSNTLEVSESVTNENVKPVDENVENIGAEVSVNATSNSKSAAIEENEEERPKTSIWRFPMEKSIGKKIWWLYTWPLKFILGLTIPSPVTHRKFYPLAFFMCIIWIGVNSYFVSWSMTVIGHTFFIPDSVMGMTFLAFGGCLPEACSIFIMSRRGEGGMGVSNALGANTLAILFALGLPWLIRTLSLVSQGADSTVVYINSAGIDFVVGSLLVAVSILWIALFIAKFKLRRSLGIILICIYLIFITFAILVEMGVILDRGIPMC